MSFIAWLVLLATGLVAGPALYGALVEHPARLAAGAETALAQWRPSYRRGKLMQASLAVVGAAAALLDGVFGVGGGISIVAGLLLAAAIPFTMLVIYRSTGSSRSRTGSPATPRTCCCCRAGAGCTGCAWPSDLRPSCC